MEMNWPRMALLASGSAAAASHAISHVAESSGMLAMMAVGGGVGAVTAGAVCLADMIAAHFTQSEEAAGELIHNWNNHFGTPFAISPLDAAINVYGRRAINVVVAVAAGVFAGYVSEKGAGYLLDHMQPPVTGSVSLPVRAERISSPVQIKQQPGGPI